MRVENNLILRTIALAKPLWLPVPAVAWISSYLSRLQRGSEKRTVTTNFSTFVIYVVGTADIELTP